jgi:alginate O-acetyltransferase complex protein AlgI
MLLTEGGYYIFLIAVFLAYWIIARKIHWRITFLALVSYFFYAYVGWIPVLLLFAVSTIDYSTTRFMSRTQKRRKRQILLATSLTVEIGTLCVFKYANFFLETATSGLSLLGVKTSLPHLNIIIPLGISFFIFQSIAYVVDVYRKDTQSVQNYLDYIAFISFFPTIIAGPILRAKQFIPQLRSQFTLDSVTGGQALFLIAIGIMKKIAIADYLSVNLVDRVFDFPERFSSLEVLAAVYGYALQIYADFSGYSDIAIGSAMLLGLKVPDNFNAPYRSRDLPEFWRRWHISLSTWLRDYVFFAVVGPRSRNGATLYFGLIATMLLGGLWHGPTWSFVFWGLLHGAGLAAVRGFAAARKQFKLPRLNNTYAQILGVFLTFHFVCFTWIFFRASGLDNAIGILRQISWFTADTSNLGRPLLLILAVGYLAHWVPDRIWVAAQSGFVRLPSLAQACLLAILAMGLYSLANSEVAPFIYARF